MLNTADIAFSPDQKISVPVRDLELSKKSVKLIYVQDSQPGISRTKRNNTFYYFLGKKRISDAATLTRIKNLVIPPAWNKVWICPCDNGHLQATGIDGKDRKQYKYHTAWSALRNHTKFYGLLEFGKAIPMIRLQVEKDLLLPGMPLQKVLAAVVYLMEQTSIRVGNSTYEKLYGSFGLTTLKDKHVDITGAELAFSFKGKKGVAHKVSIKNQRLARIVRQCREIPGKELFQYYDDQGNHKSIDSGMVNQYLKDISGKDFTAKYFRTWAGSVQALVAFKEIDSVNGSAPAKTQIKKNIVTVLDCVAKHLGNTRAVCKKYYVHPILLSLYESNHLQIYLKRLKGPKLLSNAQKAIGVSREENVLMNILKKHG